MLRYVKIADPESALAESLGPLSASEAGREAQRCLYCFDAPCIHACPTHIDIPVFIKKIANDNVNGAARTILEANAIGSTCARVCPVQELCEGACVLGGEDKPISIGRLQRYATDFVSERNIRVLKAGPSTGRRVAVVGAGPAGLSCAAELAQMGDSVEIFEKRELPGGLSTYGIIALREPTAVSLREVEMIKALGVTIHTGRELGGNLEIDELLQGFDAVYLGLGLGAVPALGVPGEEFLIDGLQWIEEGKMNPESLEIGGNVAVIGAGNTAIDAATIAKRLGAQRVTMIYRRGEEEMSAYRHEYEFAKNEGIEYRFLTQPVAIISDEAGVKALRCVRTELVDTDESGRAWPRAIPGTEFEIPADQVISAIGQEKPSIARVLGLDLDKGYIRVDEEFRTSRKRIYAGGDCIRARGNASTVMAVEDGKRAAEAIHRAMAGVHA